MLICFSDDWNSVAHVFPFEMENGTEPFGTGKCFKFIPSSGIYNILFKLNHI